MTNMGGPNVLGREGERACTYRGQTGRPLHASGLEHLRAVQRGDQSSALTAHYFSKHPGLDPEDRLLEVKILDTRALNMERGIMESLLINQMEENSNVQSANRRTEWARVGIRQLSIADR